MEYEQWQDDGDEYQGMNAGGDKRKVMRWSQSEHQRLNELVQEAWPDVRWPRIAKQLGTGRTGKQCRERWMNARPDNKKGQWTLEEDMVIARMHAQVGPSWSKIAKCLDCRTENDIKNHWNAQVRCKNLDARINCLLAVYVRMLRDGAEATLETYERTVVEFQSTQGLTGLTDVMYTDPLTLPDSYNISMTSQPHVSAIGMQQADSVARQDMSMNEMPHQDMPIKAEQYGNDVSSFHGTGSSGQTTMGDAQAALQQFSAGEGLLSLTALLKGSVPGGMQAAMDAINAVASAQGNVMTGMVPGCDIGSGAPSKQPSAFQHMLSSDLASAPEEHNTATSHPSTPSPCAPAAAVMVSPEGQMYMAMQQQSNQSGQQMSQSQLHMPSQHPSSSLLAPTPSSHQADHPNMHAHGFMARDVAISQPQHPAMHLPPTGRSSMNNMLNLTNNNLPAPSPMRMSAPGMVQTSGVDTFLSPHLAVATQATARKSPAGASALTASNNRVQEWMDAFGVDGDDPTPPVASRPGSATSSFRLVSDPGSRVRTNMFNAMMSTGQFSNSRLHLSADMATVGPQMSAPTSATTPGSRQSCDGLLHACTDLRVLEIQRSAATKRSSSFALDIAHTSVMEQPGSPFKRANSSMHGSSGGSLAQTPAGTESPFSQPVWPRSAASNLTSPHRFQQQQQQQQQLSAHQQGSMAFNSSMSLQASRALSPGLAQVMNDIGGSGGSMPGRRMPGSGTSALLGNAMPSHLNQAASGVSNSWVDDEDELRKDLFAELPPGASSVRASLSHQGSAALLNSTPAIQTGVLGLSADRSCGGSYADRSLSVVERADGFSMQQGNCSDAMLSQQQQQAVRMASTGQQGVPEAPSPHAVNGYCSTQTTSMGTVQRRMDSGAAQLPSTYHGMPRHMLDAFLSNSTINGGASDCEDGSFTPTGSALSVGGYSAMADDFNQLSMATQSCGGLDRGAARPRGRSTAGVRPAGSSRVTGSTQQVSRLARSSTYGGVNSQLQLNTSSMQGSQSGYPQHNTCDNLVQGSQSGYPPHNTCDNLLVNNISSAYASGTGLIGETFDASFPEPNNTVPGDLPQAVPQLQRPSWTTPTQRWQPNAQPQSLRAWTGPTTGLNHHPGTSLHGSTTQTASTNTVVKAEPVLDTDGALWDVPQDFLLNPMLPLRTNTADCDALEFLLDMADV